VSSPVDDIISLHFLAISVAAIQVIKILISLPSKNFSLRWKVKALFLLPVLPFIAFFDVYVSFFKSDFE